MKIIHKYEIYSGYTNIIVNGVNAKPVMFNMQENGAMHVWIEHEMSGISTPLQFSVIGTGQSIMSDFTYVDSVFDDCYVWHLYYTNGV